MNLCLDPDEPTRTRAFTTLKRWNAAELKQVFSNPNIPAPMFEFAIQHLVPERQELAEALISNSSLPEHLRRLIRSKMAGSNLSAGAEEDSPSEAAPERQTLHQKISRMTVAEKINAALMGSQEERAVLVRDSNKIVARAVLQSPKLSDPEVEHIATMKNVSEEVLRLIATNRKFIKSYEVVRSVVNNPRTPIDAGLSLINRLNGKDLKDLSRNKNVPEVIRSMGAKLVRQKEDANKPRIPHKH